MAKQFTIPFKSFYGTNCTIDIYSDSFSGSVTELNGGIPPITIENSRTSSNNGANGIIETFFKINAISTTDLNNTSLQSEEYGDMWFEYKEGSTVKYRGVISPFETGSPYDADGYYTLGISAEIGLNELKDKEIRNADGSPLEGRVRLIDIIALSLKSLTLTNTFNIKSFVSIDTYVGATEVGADTDFFSRYVDAEAFKIGLNEWMSCFEALETVLSGKFDLYFDNENWVIDYPLNSLAATRNITTYDPDGVYVSRVNSTINKPLISDSIIKRGGTEGRQFSKKNVKIEHKINSISNKITNPNFEFTGFDIIGWTNESSISSLEIGGYGTQVAPYYAKIGGSVYSKTTPTDTEYIESTAFDWYPVGRSDFADRELSTYYDEDEKLSFNIKGEYGSGISGARIQIIATYEKIRANQPQSIINDPTPTIIYDSKTIYYTNEGWSSEPAWYITGRGAIEEIQVSPPPLRFTSTLSYKALPYVRYDVPTPTAVSVKLRLFRGDRKKIGEATGEVGGYTYYSKFFSASASTWLLADEPKLKGGNYEYVTGKKTDRDSGVTIPVSLYERVSPFAFGSIFVDDTTTSAIDGFKRLGTSTVQSWLDFVATDFLRSNDVRLINLVLPFMDTFYPSQVFIYDSRLFRVHDFEKDVSMDSTTVTLMEVRYSSSAVSLKISDTEFTEVLKEARPQKYKELTPNDNLYNKGGRIGLNDRLESLSQINLEGEGIVFGDAIKSNAGIIYLQKEGVESTNGIYWVDSLNENTDYIRPETDGFVFKSESSPYEVTLDFTELTANTKLIIPPLSADAYLLTSENGWVLEGNNISTAKKLGSTTAQDWTIIHNDTTIATVNSSGINLGENLLTAGGVQFDLTPTQTGAVGKMMWNDTDGTLEFGMKGGNVTQQIGQELPVLVKHADNTGLANGAVVYVVGSDGSNKTVRYALANAESTSSKTFGVMTEDASGGNKAFCTTFGIVRDIDTSALTEGAAVYLSPTVAGGMTTTKPSAPNHMVLVGFCIRSHATVGSIFVKIINGFELNEIHDVAIGTLANNNLLAYESATSLWKNKTYSELGLFPTPSGLTTNYIPKWNGTALANSQIFDSGTFVGIGTATPATLLDVRGQISASLGSASAPAFSFVGDLNTGIYSPSADTLALATAGTSRMSITSAGDVIIGSAAGTNSLIVSKNITGGTAASGIRSSGQIQSDVTSEAYLFRSVMNQANFALTTLIGYESSIGTISGTGTNLINFRAASSSAGYTNVFGFNSVIASGTNRWNAYFSGTAQNYFRGNVGIGSGSTVPATELEVRGVISASLGSASLPSHTFVGDLNNGWWSPAADTQAWSLSGAEVMRLNATGLGIGVTPSYKLDVSGTGHFTGSVTFDTVPSSLQDATSANHLVRYSQWISSTTVKYLPTAVKTVSLTNITLSGTQTINGVALVAGDRILVTGQTAGAENGVWVVAAGAWSRATDSDTDSELRGYIINISGGTYAGYKYINTNGSTITVGTTAITYSEFSNVSEIDPVFVSWRDSTRTANTFWAAPNGSNGVATWRSLVAADVPTLNQNTTGSAATLTTSRNIAISGDLTWNVDFNGSANVTAVGTLATVNSNVGTFAGITVNGKGLVTAATALTTLSGYGITDAQSTLVSGTNIKTVGTQSLLGSGDVTLASLNYWTKTGSNVSYVGGNVYAPYFESNGAIVALASTGTDNYTILGVGSTSFQQKVYDVTNPRLETISSAGVLGTIFNGGNYRFGTGTDSGLAKVQVVGAIQQSNVTNSYIKANASGVLIAGTITTLDVSDLSSYTGFDSRYFTETESDARFVALAGSYANPTWITSLAWSKLTSVPSTFAPSAHTLDSHSNVTITSNSNGEILKWNGSAWINNTLAEAGIQATLSGTGFVKSTSGVISYDTNTYLTGNQTISISGDATGSGATSIALTLANSGVTSGTYRSVTVNAKGLVTGATNPTTISGYGITDFYSQVVSGFVTGANSSVLNTDTLEVALEKLQGQINARISGNQTITLSGIVTGSGTTAITTAIADSALSISKTSGLQTALDSKQSTLGGTGFVKSTAGTISYDTSTYQPLDADLTAIAGITSTSGLLKKTAANTWSLDTNTYITGNQTITLSGIVTGSGTTAITTAIADSALSIAKTSGLQTALDGKFATPSGLTTNYVSKWNGTGFSNSQTFDNGTSVGIGTASPSSTSKMHVNNAVGNSVRFQNTYFSNALESSTSFARGGIFNNAEYIDEGGATKVWKIRNYGANDAAGILFSNSGTLNFISVPNTGTVDKSLTHSELLSNARMTILSSGFVGINTTSPAYTLDVVGTIRTTSLMITSGATVGSFLKANNVNGTSIWASITTSDISNLSSWTGSTSITTLGTIATGVWSGTAIGITKGGTGLTALGTANQLLRVNSGATALEYFTPTYISGNQTITLSGVVTGSGSTSITTAIANGAITNAMLANTAVSNLSGTNTGDNSPNSLYSGLVSNATHTGDATGATSLTVVGIRGVALPTLGITAGFLRYTGTSANTWVFDTSTYLTANQSISITGDATGTGTTSIALTLANVATAGTYRSVTINSKGLVTSGTNPTTISGYGITDFYSQVVSGFVTGANSTVLNTDTLEVALEKLQGQINARISGNQTITLSGVVTGSGTTAITTSIADGALSIAKTSGLQTALDGKMATASYPDLVAIEALTGTSGLLKKTAANTWALDTNTYLTANQTITLSGDVSGSGTTSITATLATITQASSGNFRKITLDTKGRVTGNTAVVIGDLTTLLGTNTYLPYYSGAANYLTKWLNTTGSIVNSIIYDNGTNIGIGNSFPDTKVHLSGNLKIDGGTGYMLLGNVDGTYWIDVPSTNLNLYGTSVVSKNNHNFEFKIGLSGNYGTAGQVLTSQGPSANPTWTTVSEVSLANTQIGFGNASNLLSGNAALTWQDGRYISIKGSSANFNLGGATGAGFIESVNGNLLLQARSTYGVVVDEGYFQVDALGGGGTKMVVVDNNGKFGTQTIPSGGGGVPALTATQIGFGDGSNLMTSSANFVYDATKTAIYLNDSSNYLYVGKSVSLSDMYEITAVGTRGIQLNTDMDIVIKNNNHLYLGSGASNKRVHIGRGASYNDANHYLVINGETFSFSMDNISGWGDSNSASTPQVGDKVLFNVVDVGGQKRFVPQKINKKLFSSLTSGDTVLIL